MLKAAEINSYDRSENILNDILNQFTFDNNKLYKTVIDRFIDDTRLHLKKTYDNNYYSASGKFVFSDSHGHKIKISLNHDREWDSIRKPNFHMTDKFKFEWKTSSDHKLIIETKTHNKEFHTIIHIDEKPSERFHPAIFKIIYQNADIVEDELSEKVENTVLQTA